ncbi:thioredoxin domain-containing protein [Thiosocius teredinicola]|uniref:thioredoxin domain-containing protein n=1 Tax=Thiosocius teredinicola TaxID=1973002 RepID=UPI0009910C28
MTTHRLRDATSPYLQQHADNPVDWWPWCDEALALARSQGKPILLSIGYSACHWCHVMAHESFEDPQTAEVMNELYVNIKVDREERPDLDKIYQTAHQLLARRAGGWPLTVFLTPDDLSPFFAGTYFPPAPRHGLPAFRDLLQQIARAYNEQRDAIDEQNASLRQALLQLDRTGSAGAAAIDDQPINEAINQLAGQFDAELGGFGGAPKFPHPVTLRFLLAQGVRRNDDSARHMALHTLEKMANGGINDHLGGGFCRYSVDELWMIPHFEKMLYDNGQLLDVYAQAWAADGQRPLFKHVCERIAEWTMREMQSPQGGYYASLDADSEGEEGRYYVWMPDEVKQVLDADEYKVFAARFGLNRPANFEGSWHLHAYADTQKLATKTGLEPRRIRQLLASARDKLFAVREQRVRPGRDEKILTSWNALMIKGMANAGRRLGRPEWIDSAQRALDYLIAHHWRDGRLLATSRDGQAQLNAYLDDYAYLLAAILEVLQARWRSDYLDLAQQLAERLVSHFEDREQGAFYFTSDDHESLVHRPKSLGDDATPSGNAIALESLQTLALLVGDTDLQDATERTIGATWQAIQQAPYAHVGLLMGLQAYLDPPEQIIVRGPADTANDWAAPLAGGFAPQRTVFIIPDDAAGLPAGLAAKQAAAGKTLAYRCRGQVCEPPVEEVASLMADDHG